MITVNDSRQVESSDVNAPSLSESGSTTDEAGLSHARFGIEGNKVNEIAATTCQSLSLIARCWMRDIRGQRRKREIADPTSRERSSDRRSASSLELRRWICRLLVRTYLKPKTGGIDVQCSSKSCAEYPNYRQNDSTSY